MSKSLQPVFALAEQIARGGGTPSDPTASPLSDGLLSDDELHKFVVLAIYAATEVDKRDALPESELRSLLDWANGVRIDAGMLENVLTGDMFIRWDAESKQPTFQLSPKGEASVKAMMERSASSPAPEED